jgi:virginiamycin A acetyltransferase
MAMFTKLIGRLSVLFYNAYGKSKQINVIDPSKINPSAIIEGAYVYGDVSIGKNVRITKGVHISGNISIGDHSSVSGPNTDIYGHVNKILIGKFCSIARNVSFQEYYHYSNRLSTSMINSILFSKDTIDDVYSKGDIVIGHDVWIGTHSIILSGVKIGNGAIVGANSVVTEDIPDYAIAVGSPARVIGKRFDQDIIDKLNELQWWDWSVEKLQKYRNHFANSVTLEMLNSLIKNE